ncbi:hypothetical protein JEM67_08935 [Serratia sp. PAMC26656]|nr:hypothetical protein [Serratia sp. PAMC26656]
MSCIATIINAVSYLLGHAGQLLLGGPAAMKAAVSLLMLTTN